MSVTTKEKKKKSSASTHHNPLTAKSTQPLPQLQQWQLPLSSLPTTAAPNHQNTTKSQTQTHYHITLPAEKRKKNNKVNTSHLQKSNKTHKEPIEIRSDHRKSYGTIGRTTEAQIGPSKPHCWTIKNTIGHRITTENGTTNQTIKDTVSILVLRTWFIVKDFGQNIDANVRVFYLLSDYNTRYPYKRVTLIHQKPTDIYSAS